MTIFEFVVSSFVGLCLFDVLVDQHIDYFQIEFFFFFLTAKEVYISTIYADELVSS